MSFSVFSCRTIINSLRREEGGERKNCEILTGRILLACLESRFSSQGTVKPPRSWSLGLQRCRHHGGGCWMATLRARMSFANRNRSPPPVVGRRRAGSLSAAAASPPHLGNHLHWKWKLPSRELRRELPPPAAARPVVDQ